MGYDLGRLEVLYVNDLMSPFHVPLPINFDKLCNFVPALLGLLLNSSLDIPEREGYFQHTHSDNPYIQPCDAGGKWITRKFKLRIRFSSQSVNLPQPDSRVDMGRRVNLNAFYS